MAAEVLEPVVVLLEWVVKEVAGMAHLSVILVLLGLLTGVAVAVAGQKVRPMVAPAAPAS